MLKSALLIIKIAAWLLQFLHLPEMDAARLIPGAYFFMVFFIPSFVVVVTMVLYFVVYFLVSVCISILMGMFPFLAAIPAAGRLAIAAAVAAGAIYGWKKAKSIPPRGVAATLSRMAKGAPERFGNKAVSLGLLNAAGLRTPFGYAISSTMYARYAEQNEVPNPYKGGKDSLAANLENARNEIRDGGFSLTDALILRWIYWQLWFRGGREPVMIVRSSFGGEDVPGKLAPGQYASYSTSGSFAAFLKTIRECWSSYYTEAAHEYRQRMGVPHEPALGIVAQIMLKPSYIGTAAAANPATGYREKFIIDISAPPEGGEGQVTEQGAAETVIVDMSLGVPGGVPGFPFIQELALLLDDLCDSYGDVPIVEWAWSEGKLYFLQLRPLTGLPEVETYVSSGMAEISGDVFSPLTLSLISKVRSLDAFITEPIKKYRDIEIKGEILKSFSGRVYGSYKELRRIRRESRVSGGEFLKFLKLCETGLGEIGAVEEDVGKFLSGIEPGKIGAMGDEELTELIKKVNGKLQGEGAGAQALAAHMSMALTGLLEALGEACGMAPGKAASMPLYEEGCVAVERERMLGRLVAAAVPPAPGREATVPPLGVDQSAWDEYMKRFGFLCPGDELDLSVERVREKPLELSARIGALSAAGYRYSKGEKISGATIREIGWDAFIPWDRILFGRAYKLARKYATAREELRYKLLEGLALLRDLCLEAGGREPWKNILYEKGDAFFLEADELLSGKAVDRETVLERKRKFVEWKKTAGAGTIHVGPGGGVLKEEEALSEPTAGTFRGIPSSPGKAEGTARYIVSPEDAVMVRDGDIAVVDSCSPWMAVVLSRAAGVVAMSGGIVSHLSLSAREYGAPMIVGVSGVSPARLDKKRVALDAVEGFVKILEDER